MKPEYNTYAISSFWMSLCASSTWSQDDSASAADDKEQASPTLEHGGLSSLLSVTCSDDIMPWGDNLEMAFLFTIRDGVGEVVMLEVNQCSQRSIAMDTHLHDGISESLYHTIISALY